MRGVFFDESDARAVAAELTRAGWHVEVARDRLAGEDDDEDHPWSVRTDAPEPLLDVLVDARDGWLDLEQPDPPPLPPLVLPRAPRRGRPPVDGGS